ncbi:MULTISPECIES: EcoAI/FtnUII family type I restriction enzme subunit R [Salinibacter]|uniref:EcoAI/FtnUII family type I restriction enzme subunit R n=1 Tax=Salinibacter TaxID=146918 RepID=UPI0021E7EB50|nr:MULTISPECIES: DEAD/DEAH box helicase family protein [Salinibacter]
MGQLTEQETRSRHITPAIKDAGWPVKRIREEYSFTDGRIVTRRTRGEYRRSGQKKVDYLLFYKPNIPLAVVEAKKRTKPLGSGMQQGLDYADALEHARDLDVPFVYSSNGKAFLEHDRTETGGERERRIPLDQFPSPDELWHRYRQWKGLDEEDEDVVLQDYYKEVDGKTPRYYQRVAVNRAVERIAKGQDRLLLVMATGTGKTYTAFQIIWRLWKSGQMSRVLFLADRNILVDQAITNDFRPFGERMTKIRNHEPEKAYEIYMALYQAVTGGDTYDDIYTEYSKDFFDLVIVDECHRGSAKANSEWRDILEYFEPAVQIGMTATPKETEDVSNRYYFGDPVYEYTLKQGINDGFLAPYRVVRVGLDRDLEGYRPEKGKRDRHGREIEDREYTRTDFDRDLVLSERTKRVAEKITEYLEETDPYSKTIVFCEDIEHAERMRQALVNENPERVDEDSRYVMRITGDSDEGKRELDNFIDPESRYPVIATTSQMLSTGVDVQTCELIVLDRNIRSTTNFKQIIGRGTRIREEFDKVSFTIMDFRGVTRHFADPEFDGTPEQEYEPGPDDSPVPPDDENVSTDGEPPEDDLDEITADDDDGERGRKYYVDDVEVEVVNERVKYYTPEGDLVTESLTDYTRRNVREQFASLDDFLQRWNRADRKQAVIDELEAQGVFIDELRQEVDKDLDPFDLICHVAFDAEPLTRSERAEKVRESDYFDQYGEEAREVLDALLDKYADEGIENIEQKKVLKVDPLNQFGGPVEIVQRFGGADRFDGAVRELEDQLYQMA